MLQLLQVWWNLTKLYIKFKSRVDQSTSVYLVDTPSNDIIDREIQPWDWWNHQVTYVN